MIRMLGLPPYIAVLITELVACGVDLVAFGVCSDRPSEHPERAAFALQPGDAGRPSLIPGFNLKDPNA